MHYLNYSAMQTFSIRNPPKYAAVEGMLRGDQPKGLEAIARWLESQVEYFVLSGYAGTGKTFLTSSVVDILLGVMWNRIAITTPTHQAKLVLTNTMKKNGVNIGDERVSISTIHSFLGLIEVIDDDGNIQFRPGWVDEPPYTKEKIDILIVDEGSMVGVALAQYIDDAQKATGCHVLVVGDRMQIPPVNEEESAIFSMLYNRDIRFGMGNSTFNLETIIRQAEGNPIIDMAYDIRVEAGNNRTVRSYNLALTGGDKRIKVAYSLQDPEIQELISHPRMFEEARFMKFITYRNKNAEMYNTYIRGVLRPDYKDVQFTEGDRLIMQEPLLDESGRRILLPNNAEVIVHNASLEEDGGGEYAFKVWVLTVSCVEVLGANKTVVLKARPKNDSVFEEIVNLLRDTAKAFRKGSPAAKSAWVDYMKFVKSYVRVTYSYAITCHKSQGSTYQWAVIDEQDIFSCSRRYEAARIGYTAITRAAEGVVILKPSGITRETRLRVAEMQK